MRRLRQVAVRPLASHSVFSRLTCARSIVRAFLVEEAKIVKKVIKEQQKGKKGE